MNKSNLGILALVAIALAGCGGKGGSSKPATRVSHSGVTGTITWPASASRVVPLNTALIRITLAAPGIAPRVFNATPPATPGGTSSFQFDDVPVGDNYTIKAEALPAPSAVPLATSTSAPFPVPEAGVTGFSVIMATTVDRLTLTYNNNSYTITGEGVLTDSSGMVIPKLVFNGKTNLSIDARNSATELVLVGASTITATSPVLSLDPPTSGQSYEATPSSTATSSTLTVTYTYQTGSGNSTTFTVPISTDISAALSYTGTKDQNGNYVRGNVYGPTFVTASGTNVGGVYTLEKINVGDPDPATFASISASGVLTIKPGNDSFANASFKVKAVLASAVAETTVTIGPDLFTFRANGPSWFKFGKARYTLSETAPGDIVYSGLLDTGIPLPDPIKVQNRGRNYADKIEYFTNTDGTGPVLARVTGSPYAFTPGLSGLTADPLTPNVLVTAVDALSIAGNPLVVSPGVPTFTLEGGKSYAVVPTFTIEGTPGVALPTSLVDVAVSTPLDGTPFGFKVVTYAAGKLIVTPNGLTAPTVATIVVRYQTGPASFVTQSFVAKVTGTGTIGGIIH